MEKLEEIALQEEQWRTIAEGVLAGEQQLGQQVVLAAAEITKQLLSGELSHRSLRRGIYWANALDNEACRVYSSDWMIGGDQLERIARRAMHHTGRAAIEGFKSEKRRQERAVESARITARARMGMVG